jgi:hypothetical protein
VQKAYIFDWQSAGPELEFELLADTDFYGVASTIVNPAIVVKNWGRDPVQLAIDDEPVVLGKNFRVGYEETASGVDLVMWLRFESTEPVNVSLRKGKN